MTDKQIEKSVTSKYRQTTSPPDESKEILIESTIPTAQRTKKKRDDDDDQTFGPVGEKSDLIENIISGLRDKKKKKRKSNVHGRKNSPIVGSVRVGPFKSSFRDAIISVNGVGSLLRNKSDFSAPMSS